MQQQDSSLRIRIEQRLARDGVSATPQAVSAIENAISCSIGEECGDTDTLLVGLLLSGSYAVDALELSGANVSRLLERAKQSVATEWLDKVQPFEAFFDSLTGMSSYMLSSARRTGRLDTADILQYSVAPVSIAAPDFGLNDSTSLDIVDQAIRSLALDTLATCYEETIATSKRLPDREFARRSHALTAKERRRLKDHFGDDTGLQVAKLFDVWFESRQIPKDPGTAELLVDLDHRSLGYGADLFISEGGNYEILDKNLKMASLFNPERDSSQLVVCERDGRIVVGQYTYRNSLYVNTPDKDGFPFQRLSIQAIRPLPLLSPDTLNRFELLLNCPSTSETDIQQFLNLYPEIVTSFGSYLYAHPHIALTEVGKDKMIPDYLLELPVDRQFHILDLKLPTARLTAGGRYLRISAELQSAIAQLRSYRKYFDNADNRKRFIRAHGLEPYRPEVVVVMGRSSEFPCPDARKDIEEQMGTTRLVTYDDLLTYGRTRILNLSQ